MFRNRGEEIYYLTHLPTGPMSQPAFFLMKNLYLSWLFVRVGYCALVTISPQYHLVKKKAKENLKEKGKKRNQSFIAKLEDLYMTFYWLNILENMKIGFIKLLSLMERLRKLKKGKKKRGKATSVYTY